MKKIILFVFITLTFANQFFAQTDEKIAIVDSMANLYSDYYGFCGTVLIEKNGEILLNKGYGYASYELDIKASDSTKYQINSITKGFTRVVFDHLVNEGKINYNDKLIKYLPEIGQDKGNKIKIKHLLIHQTGLQEKFLDDISRETRLFQIKEISKLELNFEPGTKEEYCNLNYTILGLIIERVSGYDLASAFEEFIFKPLGIKSASLDNAERMLTNMAIPHYVNQVNQTDKYIHVYPKNNGKGYAAGGIIMTTEDLLKWAKAYHSNAFNLETENLENNTSKRYGKAYDNYSVGWTIDGEKIKYAEVDGIGDGFRSLYLYFPDDDITIMYLTNSYYFPSDYTSSRNIVLYDNIIYNAANIMLGRSYQLPKPTVGQILIEKAKKGSNATQLISKYKELNKRKDNFVFDVKQLNKLAYFLMENNRHDDALKILNLNKKSYPEHWIVFDGFAEYYIQSGDKENAIKFLKLSLEKNPNKWREQRKMNDIRRNQLEILNLRKK